MLLRAGSALRPDDHRRETGTEILSVAERNRTSGQSLRLLYPGGYQNRQLFQNCPGISHSFTAVLSAQGEEEGDPDGGDAAGICTVLRILFERGG